MTDAVVTAIAVASPFSDDVLEDLRPLLTYAAAKGLWRLAAAASTTRAEREVFQLADSPDAARARRNSPPTPGDSTVLRAQRIAFVLRYEDVRWHADWRNMLALRLARGFLSEPDSERAHAMLAAQKSDWDLFRSDLENAHPFDGLTGDLQEKAPYFEGRGRTAVWRAERQIELQDLLDWPLTRPYASSHARTSTGTHTPRRLTKTVTPPGWDLTMPSGWHSIVLPFNAPLPQGWQETLKQRRLLRLRSGASQALWPVIGPPGHMKPVPNLEVVLESTAGMTDADIIELLLLELDCEQFGGVHVPARVAHRLGFISEAERDELIRRTRIVNQAAMQAALQAVARDADEQHLAALRSAMNSPSQFLRLIGRELLIQTPTWRWAVGSLADAVAGGATPAALRWLTGYVQRGRSGALSASMQTAWDEAFRAARESLSTDVRHPPY
ncbi:hypothetical protein ACI792_13020 [Blastococcus sp. SYSU DS0669]